MKKSEVKKGTIVGVFVLTGNYEYKLNKNKTQ